ncbi:MAG TPA: hypothetical protein VF867_15200 [Arthrobacter sp.]
MEPFAVISTPEELAALRIDAIISPPRIPSSALRKAVASFTPNAGRSDIFVGFESTREWNIDEAWSILTMHCPAGAPEAWVLWDPAAAAPERLAPSSWTSFIPSRRPATKAHTSLGYAKAAVSQRVHAAGGAAEDMSIQELNPVTGKYETLFTVLKGTPKSQMPW